MIPRIYLGGGSVLLLALAWSAWNGWEFKSAQRGMPTPGVALAASMVRSGSSSSGRSSSSWWYSSGSRSGASVFGGK